ncbi:MAG: hypothetical protein ACR2PO_15920 [Methyloligellaceae bacterium]
MARQDSVPFVLLVWPLAATDIAVNDGRDVLQVGRVLNVEILIGQLVHDVHRLVDQLFDTGQGDENP